MYPINSDRFKNKSVVTCSSESDEKTAAMKTERRSGGRKVRNFFCNEFFIFADSSSDALSLVLLNIILSDYVQIV